MIYNSTKKINYSDINLIKYVQNLYVNNYKTLMKETKDLNKWRDFLYS